MQVSAASKGLIFTGKEVFSVLACYNTKVHKHPGLVVCGLPSSLLSSAANGRKVKI
jgi:hypothetical protein